MYQQGQHSLGLFQILQLNILVLLLRMAFKIKEAFLQDVKTSLYQDSNSYIMLKLAGLFTSLKQFSLVQHLKVYFYICKQNRNINNKLEIIPSSQTIVRLTHLAK